MKTPVVILVDNTITAAENLAADITSTQLLRSDLTKAEGQRVTQLVQYLDARAGMISKRMTYKNVSVVDAKPLLDLIEMFEAEDHNFLATIDEETEGEWAPGDCVDADAIAESMIGIARSIIAIIKGED